MADAAPLDPNDPVAMDDARGWAVCGDAEMLERNYTTGAMLHAAASAWALISIAESLQTLAAVSAEDIPEREAERGVTDCERHQT